jgi:hypothetical protein
MNNSVVQLQQYRDKCFIMNILCEKSVEYFSLMKNIVSVPLIISSAIMTIMNSGSFTPESMQTPNIVVNACTTIIISFMNNFKLAEKCNTFRTLGLKYTKLLHYIEDKLNTDEIINGEDVREIVKEYDSLAEQNECIVPSHIRTKIKKLYASKRTLPNILNCEIDFVQKVDIVIANNNKPKVLDVKPLATITEEENFSSYSI